MIITNEQVKTALDECIRTRWEPAVKDEGWLPIDAPACQLCDLFLVRTDQGCDACPLKLHTGKSCCDAESNYSKWGRHRTLSHTAQAVLDDLIGARKQFFGDWK